MRLSGERERTSLTLLRTKIKLSRFDAVTTDDRQSSATDPISLPWLLALIFDLEFRNASYHRAHVACLTIEQAFVDLVCDLQTSRRRRDVVEESLEYRDRRS